MDPREIKTQYPDLLDDFMVRIMGQDHMLALSNLVRYLMILDELRTVDGKDILDLGCGTGALEQLSRGNGGRVIGIDLSREQILTEIRRVAKPGATILLTVPNLANPLPAIQSYKLGWIRYFRSLARGYDTRGYIARPSQVLHAGLL